MVSAEGEGTSCPFPGGSIDLNEWNLFLGKAFDLVRVGLSEILHLLLQAHIVVVLKLRLLLQSTVAPL
jgi:hypothetical protein